eukprot:Hpha_TRINITY_DN11806_c0_g1::TRINITY_DN11806_c0_g1_i1::g.2112::m.2112
MSSGSLTSGLFGRMIAKAARPTELLDKYIAEEVVPRVKADPTLLHDDFAFAKNYPFDAAHPAPWRVPGRGADPTRADKEADAFLRTVVTVAEEDCLGWAQHLTKATGGSGGGAAAPGEASLPRVAVLNLANEWNCGGAFSIHRGSQEEYLFRCSTLPLSLWKRRRPEQDGFRAWTAGTALLGRALEDPDERWYPFTKFGGIFTPRVEVFAVGDRALPPESRFEVSVLTIAAQDCRGRERFEDAVTLQKIRTMLHMAIENRTDVLVLGALGCGAFRNPPPRVAQLFRLALRELWRSGEGGGASFPFKRVDFAIIKSRANVEAFSEAFGVPVTRSKGTAI